MAEDKPIPLPLHWVPNSLKELHSRVIAVTVSLDRYTTGQHKYIFAHHIESVDSIRRICMYYIFPSSNLKSKREIMLTLHTVNIGFKRIHILANLDFLKCRTSKRNLQDYLTFCRTYSIAVLILYDFVCTKSK